MAVTKVIVEGQKADGTYQPLKVDVSGNLVTTGGSGGGTSSSVTINDGVNVITSTNVGGKQALDVNVADIVITHANDSIRVGDGTNLVGVTATGLNSYVLNPGSKDELAAIDKASDTVTYFGFAAPGSVTAGALWKIKRAQVTGNVTFIGYADGNSNYDKVWDNRASLSYT